jgi:hypothetical protein
MSTETITSGDIAVLNVGAGNALDRPAFIPASTEGREHITRADIRLPRLALAQGLSPEIDSGHAKFIRGLANGEMFNDLTQVNYGKGPLEFFIVRADPPRWVEFFPRDEGGGVKDLNVPANDPRTAFRVGEDGSSLPPIATMFYDYVLLLEPNKEPITLSLKSTGIKAARTLNGLIQMRNSALYAGKYVVTAGKETNKKGTYSVYIIKNAGWVKDQAEAEQLRQAHEAFKDKSIEFDREPGVDEPTHDGPAGGPLQGGDHIPF